MPYPTLPAGIRCIFAKRIIRTAVKESMLAGALHQLPRRAGRTENRFKAALP